MYRTVKTCFWTDEKMRALSATANYLALYLITNPHTHMSGIYYLPRQLIELETRMPEKHVTGGLAELERAEFAFFDTGSATVFVRRMLLYQNHAGPKIKKHVAAHLSSLDSPLISKFMNEYRGWKIPYRRGIDTLSKGLRYQDQKQEQKQKQDQGQKKTIGTHESENFGIFYSTYPLQQKRPEAWKAWRAMNAEAEAEAIMRGLEAWKRCPKWQENGGEFIPYPATWLRNKRWNDKPPEHGGPHGRGRAQAQERGTDRAAQGAGDNGDPYAADRERQERRVRAAERARGEAAPEVPPVR